MSDFSFERGIKVWWSCNWRLLICNCFINLFLLALFYGMLLSGYNSLGMYEFFFSMGQALISLPFYQYIINRLSKFGYSDFIVRLKHDYRDLNSFSLWDTTCLVWSLSWRFGVVFYLVLGICFIHAAMMMTSDFLSARTPSEFWMVIDTILASFPEGITWVKQGNVIAWGIFLTYFSSLISFLWLLTVKKTGRFLAIVKKEEA